MTRLRLRRIFWIGAAAILVAAALVAVASIVRGDFSDTDGRILVTLAAFLYTGGTALAGLALCDRGPARTLGWIVVAAAPACLVLELWGIWKFAFDHEGGEDASRLAWSAVLVLLAGLMTTSGLLLARRPALVRLALVAGVLASFAAAASIVGIWTEPSSDAFAKVVAILWIFAALAFFLVPVLQRFAATSPETAAQRVLGELDGVQLVASRGDVEGVPVDAPGRGERLVLRRVA